MMAIQVYRMRRSPGSVRGSSGKFRPGSHSSLASRPAAELGRQAPWSCSMRIPVIRGVIDRRILVNYRVAPDVLAPLLPPRFRPKLHRGYGMVGICLIRLRSMRPKFLPGHVVGERSPSHRRRVGRGWPRSGWRVRSSAGYQFVAQRSWRRAGVPRHPLPREVHREGNRNPFRGDVAER